MNNFEDILKQKLSEHKLPDYNPSHWKKVEAELNKKRKKGLLFAASLLIGLGVTGSALYLNQTQSTTKPTNINNTEVPYDKNTYSTPNTNTEKETKSNKNALEVEASNETQSNTESITKSGVSNENLAKDNTSKKVLENNNTPEKKIVESDTGTVLTESALVNDKQLKQEFETKILVSVNNACVGDKVEFKIESEDPISVVWHFGDKSNTDKPNPKHVYENAGMYYPYAEVTFLLDGKTKDVYFDKPLKIFGLPQAEIEVEETESENFRRVFKFTPVTEAEIIEYNWLTNNSNGKSLSKEINTKGLHEIAVEITDKNGCTNIVRNNLSLKTDYNLLAPTAFTPDNDGMNDNFIPKALYQAEDGTFTFKVIEPNSGKVLHQSNSFNNPWKGIDPSTGETLKGGTYLWSVALDIDGVTNTYSGSVKIVVN